MKFHQRTVAMAAAIGFLIAPAASAQTPAPATPAAPAAPRKLISPIRGEATVEFTNPDTKRKGADVVTIMVIKNTSPGPIAGFILEESWSDKIGQPGRRRRLSPSETVHAGRGDHRDAHHAGEPPHGQQQLQLQARQRHHQAEEGAEDRRPEDRLERLQPETQRRHLNAAFLMYGDLLREGRRPAAPARFRLATP